MNKTFDYRDPLEISEELAKLGQFTKITQLDGGNGIYTMQAATANKVKYHMQKYLPTKPCCTRDGATV